MKSILIALFLSTQAYATCTYKVDAKDLKVDWAAYKTPLKVAVGGTFKELGLKKKKYLSESFKDLLSDIEFKIDASSTDTGSWVRDKKIVKFFFKPMKGGAIISGKTISYSKKILNIEIKMNGVTKKVPLTVVKNQSDFKASGVIDVLDFTLGESLAGINKACLKLHEGKTWSDVAISLSAKYTESCK